MLERLRCRCERKERSGEQGCARAGGADRRGGFGLKVGRTTPKRFAGRIGELVAGHATLEVVAASLLAVHEVMRREFGSLEKRVRSMAREDARARLLMSAPGVGAIVALTYVS